MRILHYLFGLPPVHKGGVPTYVLDLAHMQQRFGHHVCLLMPGKVNKNGQDISILPKHHFNLKCYEVINSSYIANEYGVVSPDEFMRPASLDKYIRLLNESKFHILHLHSLLGLQIELLEAAKKLKIPIIYTPHDYYGLCPKIDLLKADKECSVNDWCNCVDCCQQAYSLKRLRFRQTVWYNWYCHIPIMMNMLHNRMISRLMNIWLPNRKKSYMTEKNQSAKIQKFRMLQHYCQSIFKMIDYYHFNSKQTREVYSARLGTLKGEVVIITKENIVDHRRELVADHQLRIGYLGSPNVRKGYYYLLEQLDFLYESGRTAFLLKTYFVQETEKRVYQRNQAPFSAKQQEIVYRGIDVLVVPSICKETFGLVVLEALSYGIPVFVSENVGSKDLIFKYPGIGCIFSTDSNRLLEVLEQVYDNRERLLRMSRIICASNMEFDFQKHVQEIIDIYVKMHNRNEKTRMLTGEDK